jgi:hypothetical protein
MKAFRILLFCLAVPAPAHGAVETFVETFDGDGSYQSITNDLVGFDNPGWEVYSDDGFAAGGFRIQNDGEFEIPASDVLERTLAGTGSFRLRVEIKNLDLGDLSLDASPDSFAHFYLRLGLHEDADEGRNVISLAFQEPLDSEPIWLFSGYSSRDQVGAFAPRGSRVAMEFVFDAQTSEVTFAYDNDTTDAFGPLSVGPLMYSGDIQETQLLTIQAASGGEAHFDGVLDFLSITPLSDIEGDFNGNGILDAADIDQLSIQVRAATNDLLYDLNADALVNDLDRQVWVHDLKRTYFGDADLSGAFDSADLVRVLGFGEYEDGVELNSTWLTGDWDGDGDFTSGDLVEALADGDYEAGAAAVPEPNCIILAIGAAAIAAFSHRRSKTRGK